MYEINVKVTLPHEYRGEEIEELGNHIHDVVRDAVDWFVDQYGYRDGHITTETEYAR